EVVRRVGEDHVVRFVGAGGEGRHDAGGDEPYVRRRAQRLDVGPGGARRARAGLHQQHVVGAARVRLQTDRAGPGVEVRDARPGEVDERLEAAEERLAYPVGGGADATTRWHLQAAAAEASGDDPRHTGDGTGPPGSVRRGRVTRWGDIRR